MKVISPYPVIYQGKVIGQAHIYNGGWDNIDGSSSSTDITAFQTFAKSQGADLGPTGIDGFWGKFTSAAWTKYGTAYTAANPAPKIADAPPMVDDQKKPAAPKVSGKQPLSKGSKFLIGIVGAAILLGIIWKVSKPKHK